MKRYKIDLPNDYGSEEDDRAMQEAYPGLEGDELGGTALQDILLSWEGEYEVEQTTDFGVIIRSTTPPPDDLPCWAWVSEDKYPDDPENTEWVKVQ